MGDLLIPSLFSFRKNSPVQFRNGHILFRRPVIFLKVLVIFCVWSFYRGWHVQFKELLPRTA
jgi:hypothetical protein